MWTGLGRSPQAAAPGCWRGGGPERQPPSPAPFALFVCQFLKGASGDWMPGTESLGEASPELCYTWTALSVSSSDRRIDAMEQTSVACLNECFSWEDYS